MDAYFTIAIVTVDQFWQVLPKPVYRFRITMFCCCDVMRFPAHSKDGRAVCDNTLNWEHVFRDSWRFHTRLWDKTINKSGGFTDPHYLKAEWHYPPQLVHIMLITVKYLGSLIQIVSQSVMSEWWGVGFLGIVVFIISI